MTGKISYMKISKYAELTVVFIGIPLLYYFNLVPFHKAIPLVFIFLVYLAIILSDKSFDRKKLGLNGFKGWRFLFIKSLIVCIGLCAVVLIFYPDRFLDIPSKMPWIWMLILVFYSIWSVLPQEFIYRVYFYRRFGDIVNNRIWLHFINAFLFSFSHIIFRNWSVLILTFLASFIFSVSYTKSKSFLAVFIEHAVYGNLVFTLGLGNFFYLPFNG